MANRPVRLVAKRTAISGRIPTGTTGNELNFIVQGELAVNTADRKLFSFDGTNVFEFGTNSFLALSGGTVSGLTNFSTISATTLSSDTYYMSSEQIFGNVIKSTPPSNTGNTWVRNTDYEQFIYDANRTKWLSAFEQKITGARASNNTTTQFLRYEDSVIFSTTPFRVPYDATVVRVVMGGNVSETWQAMITTGTTLGTNNIITLGMYASTYSAKTDYNVDINSGQTLYIGMSGTSISQPRIDVYFKRRGQ